MQTDTEITLEPMLQLVVEHRELDEVAGRADSAVDAAVRAPGDVDLASAAVTTITDFEVVLDDRLDLHIAKEEELLFPALRLDEDTTKTVDELIEQHDRIRARYAELAQALERLDAAHDEVATERDRLRERLSGLDDVPTPEQLIELRACVRQLYWILQGHFRDEEDDIFAPAETLLSREQLAAIDEGCRRLEASWGTR